MILNLLDAAFPGGVAPAGNVIYNAGYENSSVTGGWSKFCPAWAGGNTWVKYAGEADPERRTNPVGCTKKSDNLEIYWQNGTFASVFANGGFATVNLLDLSGYTTLHVQATSASSSGTHNYHVFGVTASKTPPADGTNTPPGNYKAISTGETTLDISGVSSAYVYIGGMARTNSTSGGVNIVVTKIWLT